MRKASSLTLGIFKSLYPRANLDVVGEGFAATCSVDKATKLVEDSAVTASLGCRDAFCRYVAGVEICLAIVWLHVQTFSIFIFM
jgi:hypothetical protein